MSAYAAPATMSNVPSPVTSTHWMPCPDARPNRSVAAAPETVSVAVGAGVPERPDPPAPKKNAPVSKVPPTSARGAPATMSSVPSPVTSAYCTPRPLACPRESFATAPLTVSVAVGLSDPVSPDPPAQT